MFDVVIIGAGPAGLSAALSLGRFRRSVLILDGQRPRNARSTGAHNLFSRDGIHPHELLQIAREQLVPYPTVELRAQEAINIAHDNGTFTVQLQDGSTASARYVLFATGVKDILPPIEGIEELFARSVFHCPYCHGWEVKDKAIAIVANGDAAIHFAMLLHSLSSNIAICTNGNSEIGSSELNQLDRLGINVVETPILRLEHEERLLKGVRFTDGSFLPREAIFMRPAQQQHSLLPAKLGCALTENGHVVVDDKGKTSVDGVFAAGDLMSGMQQVIFAASRGAAAAAFINYELAHQAFYNES
ncbi:MAG: NAD(P)/FAD-dependent oxidoreductase [Anaerolineae bacterium]|nr:NAD(P)/FAD-dependent oxidoreductase [Anaerolineae bacterium]